MSDPIRIFKALRQALCLFPSRGSDSYPKEPGCRDTRQRTGRFRDRRGFTLLEMLVSLIVGTLIAGGVLGLISMSMQHKFRIREKSQIQPILESAAQMVLADPARVAEGDIRLGELPGSPVVKVSSVPVQISHEGPVGKAGQLCHVILSYKSGLLEFSIIVPQTDSR